jgi:hypothetical protein
MVIVEKLVEWRLAGETEVLGENLPQYHFVPHKSHMSRSGFEPGPQRYAGALTSRNPRASMACNRDIFTF